MRYELRTGKFGSYFRDSKKDEDLPLEEVLDLLNKTPLVYTRWYMNGSLRSALNKAIMAKMIIEARLFIADAPPGWGPGIKGFTCDLCPLNPKPSLPKCKGNCAVLLNDYIEAMEREYLTL